MQCCLQEPIRLEPPPAHGRPADRPAISAAVLICINEFGPENG
jgi:hypothetical protein